MVDSKGNHPFELIMENKPWDIFGNHSQHAHDQCQSEFSKFQQCCQPSPLYNRHHLSCMQENCDLMQCLEDKEPTEPACIPPLSVYRKCWILSGEQSGSLWCPEELEALERCKEDPKKFEAEELYKYPKTEKWDVIHRF